jgi:hypothetical protein
MSVRVLHVQKGCRVQSYESQKHRPLVLFALSGSGRPVNGLKIEMKEKRMPYDKKHVTGVFRC